ncbi:hypothetical protein HOD41_03425 [bacterium]|jgi:chromosome segregation ATPase|nr:hypothetical protein [bacterium]
MNSFIKKGLSVLLIGMMAIVFAFTVQAKKAKKDKAPYLGPTVYECKTNKHGEEKCKTKKLHGQKAIEFIYQALLASNAAIALNAANIAALEINTDDLQAQINVLRLDIIDNDGEIAANAAAISNLFTQLANLHSTTATLRTDLTQLQNDTNAEASYVQGQIADIQGQIISNNNTMVALIADLEALVTQQKAELELLMETEIATLQSNTNAQIVLLQQAIAKVEADLAENDTAAADHVAYATIQINAIWQDITSLENDIDELNSTANSLASDIVQNEEDIAALNAAVLANEFAISELAGEVATVKSQITGLMTRVGANEADIALMLARISANETDIGGLRTDLTALIAATNKLADDLRIEIAAVDQAIRALTTANSGLIADLDALVVQLRTDVDANKASIDVLSLQVESNTNDISILQLNRNTMQGQIAGLLVSVGTLQNALTSLESRIAGVESGVTALQALHCNGWKWNEGCWYTAPSTNMSCNEVCTPHGGFDAVASKHAGNDVGRHFWPDKANGAWNWVSIECSSTDNNTNWGSNNTTPNPDWRFGACYVNCACNQ